MDLIRTNLNEAQKILSKVDVIKTIDLFYRSDLEHLKVDAPDSFDLSTEEAQLDWIEEEAGLIRLRTREIVGSDGRKLNIEYLTRSIKAELEENFSLPLDITLKYSYLNDVLKLYSDLESRIVEDKTFKFEFNLRLVDIKIETFNKVDRSCLSNHLESIRKTLRYEILLLNNHYKNQLKDYIPISQRKEELPSVIESPKTNKIIRKISSKNSFEIDRKRYKKVDKSDPEKLDVIIDNKLKDFHKELYKEGLVGRIEHRLFLRAFTNKEIGAPIKWQGDPKELYYLLKTLYEDKIIVHFKNYWQISCICFKAYHKSAKLCTPFSLSRCHAPTKRNTLVKLDSIIDILRSL
jgi:hypothetical protein